MAEIVTIEKYKSLNGYTYDKLADAERADAEFIKKLVADQVTTQNVKKTVDADRALAYKKAQLAQLKAELGEE